MGFKYFIFQKIQIENLPTLRKNCRPEQLLNLKHFFWSILWRTLIANHPQCSNFQVSTLKEEQLRKTLYNLEEIDNNIFSIKLAKIAESEWLHLFYLEPDNPDKFRIIIGGLSVDFYIDSNLNTINSPDILGSYSNYFLLTERKFEQSPLFKLVCDVIQEDNRN